MYLHIPFCRHRCAYCDFNTYTSIGNIQDAYVDALEAEIEQVAFLAENAGQIRPLDTIYFGGGTPSLLAPLDLSRLVQAALKNYGQTVDIEISMEANPEGIDSAHLEAIRESGINRLSFGVQSAVDAELALLQRGHDMPTVMRVVNDAQRVGFDNINLDLIYGLPDQTMRSWESSLEAAMNIKPQHLSLYCLTIEEGTPMHRWLRNGQISAPDPDLAADQYQFVCEYLANRGYIHYEISNWALPGYECRHNITYWRNQDYLGLGAGAHGQAGGYRYSLVKQPRVYIRRMLTQQPKNYPLSSAVAESHGVDLREAMSDTVIMQLRLLQEGLNLSDFVKRFGMSLEEAFNGLPRQLQEWGLLQQDKDRLLLSETGRFISNQIFYRFV